jgi:preprotein translocase subunit SecY
MFSVFKQLGNKENKDLRGRIYFTLGMLFIFVLGISVRVPGTSTLNSNYDFLQLINTLGGGALNNFSIFALGVMPYITAQIIIQLLEMDIIPYFADLAKQGATGRQKLNQISRYIGILFAFIEGYAFSYAFIGKTGSPIDYLYIATVLTAGTAFLLWMGDQVTRKGLGNGVSLIIMGGIIATLPGMFIDVFNSTIVAGSAQQVTLGIIKFVLFVIVYLAIIVGVVFEERAERRIPIQYANKSTGYGNNAQSFMPIKINAAGVMPVIFASSLSIIPSVLATVAQSEKITLFVQKYLTYNTPVGFVIYVILIFVFAYFYTFVAIKPEEFAKNLQENGGYIPGIKPGEETKQYLSKVLSRITILGGTFLTILAALPIIFQKVSTLPTTVSIGGTGLLIVVGVALETYKQLEGSLLTRSYKRGYSRR